MAMSYIIFVNPNILAESGMDRAALITATCLAAAFASFLMGLYANYPIGLAPTMGSNLFFSFVVVKQMGLTWEQALTAVLIVSVIFIIITVGKIRDLILEAIPKNLRIGIPAGIGLFLMFIGLQQSGIVVSNESTLVSLGNLKDPSTLLSIIGLILMIVFYVKKITGGILISIITITILAIPFGITKAPTGVFSTPPSIAPIFAHFDFSKILDGNFLMAVFTLLFLAVFDTIGTLMAVATRAKLIDENGKMLRSNRAFFSDAVGSTAGSIFGVSIVGAYIESIAGVESGGKTGLTAVVIGILFVAAMFFSPLITIVPTIAVAPALIFIGILMFSLVEFLDFRDWTELIPAIVAIILTPLSYNIASGIELSILIYVFLKVFTGKFTSVTKTLYVLAVLFILKEIFM